MTEIATRAPETERALAENARYAATFDRPNLELPPAPQARRPRLHGRAADRRGRPRPSDG